MEKNASTIIQSNKALAIDRLETEIRVDNATFDNNVVEQSQGVFQTPRGGCRLTAWFPLGCRWLPCLQYMISGWLQARNSFLKWVSTGTIKHKTPIRLIPNFPFRIQVVHHSIVNFLTRPE